jgi:hypothetical protein
MNRNFDDGINRCINAAVMERPGKAIIDRRLYDPDTAFILGLWSWALEGKFWPREVRANEIKTYGLPKRKSVEENTQARMFSLQEMQVRCQKSKDSMSSQTD